MHDLLYNDLGTRDLGTVADGPLDLSMQLMDGGMVGGGMSVPLSLERILDTSGGGMISGNGAGGGAWQFEGDFGNDSFWGFMNNYNP